MIVTEYGDEILPYKSKGVGGVDTYEPEPDEKLGNVMIHEVCFGFVDFKKTSKTHNILRCRACGLRVVLPIEVTTFGEAIEYFDLLEN